MPALLDPTTLPRNIVALRNLLLRREAEHAAEREQASELDAAREGLKAQVLRNERFKVAPGQIAARAVRCFLGEATQRHRATRVAVTMNIGPLVLTNIGPPPGV